MKTLNANIVGQTRYWWIVLIAGILLIIGGITYWFWPIAGYAVIAQIFGWLMIVTGVVQLCVATGANRPYGWGWWIAGGVINMFIGFLMIRNIIMSEMLFPYFLAFLFFFAGISAIFSSAKRELRSYRWINLINGILMLAIGFLICNGGFFQRVEMVSIISAVGFIYWGFTLITTSYTIRPMNLTDSDERLNVTDSED